MDDEDEIIRRRVLPELEAIMMLIAVEMEIHQDAIRYGLWNDALAILKSAHHKGEAWAHEADTGVMNLPRGVTER